MLRLGRRTFDGNEPVVMAVVHPTPYRGSGAVPASDEAPALARVEEAVAQGAAIVELDSSGAGHARPEAAVAQIRRVVDLVAEVRRRYPELVISVRTGLPTWGAALCEAGVDLLDSSGSGDGSQLAQVAARHGVGLVCGPAAGAEARDTAGWTADEVLADRSRSTVEAAERAVALGVPREAVVIDPGYDLHTASPQSLAATRRLGELTRTGWPVLVSLSPREAGGTPRERPGQEQLARTLATTSVLAWLGARVYRVDEIAQTRQALDMVASIAGHRPPALARRGRA